MKNLLLILLPLLFSFACSSHKETKEENVSAEINTAELVGLEHDLHQRSNLQLRPDLVDLDGIKERGFLTALVDNTSTSYFIYKGERMGYEYELLSKFAESIGVQLKIVVVDDLIEATSLLNEGYADILAYHLAITLQRRELFEFSIPHLEVKQVLIQRKPKNWRDMKLHQIKAQMIEDPTDLGGKVVHVRKGSSFAQRLRNLSDEIGEKIEIIEEEGQITTEQLIERVLSGEIKYTVADADVAKINYSYHPDLFIETEISLQQRIAWALNSETPELKKAVNDWLVALKQTADYQTIYDRYFKYTKSQRKRALSEFSSNSDNASISKYDELIEKEAKRIDWDWRLLAAQINQESRFDPKSVSWAGAEGLMQITKNTQKEYHLKNPFDPESNLKAGVSHLMFLDEYWKEEIPDEQERIKFILGSYNTGQGHVRDAQRLARKYGGDPYKWDDHVAVYLLKKSDPRYHKDPVVQFGYCKGIEPNNYVREILTTFQEYKTFFNSGEDEVATVSN